MTKKRLSGTHQVFISYAHEDKLVVVKIKKILDDLKIKYFLDEKDIKWGDSIVPKIGEGLQKALAIIVVISKASIRSPWVSYEIGQARALNKDVLPFVTNKNLRLPDFIHGYKYLTDLSEIRKYFLSIKSSFNSANNKLSKIPSSTNIELKIGISSKAFQPIKSTLEKLPQIINRITPNSKNKIQYSIEQLNYEGARNQFKIPNSYDIIMIDDPWIPAYNDHIYALNDDQIFNEYLEQHNYTLDDLFGTIFLKSLKQICIYQGNIIGLPIVGNVQLMIHRIDTHSLLGIDITNEVNKHYCFSKNKFEKKIKAARQLNITPIIICNTVPNDFVNIFWEILRVNGHADNLYSDVLYIDKNRAKSTARWISKNTVGLSFKDYSKLLFSENPSILSAIGWPSWIAANITLSSNLNLDNFILQKISSNPLMGTWLFALPKHPVHPHFREYAVQLMIALTVDPFLQYLLAQEGNIPVLADYTYTDKLKQIPFWKNNYFTIRDALNDSMPRPRVKKWHIVESELEKQFRQGEFVNISDLLIFQ